MNHLKILIVLFFFQILVQNGFGQITGQVTSSTGEPLIGVTVLLKGPNKGTMTDFDGNYSLDVSETKGTLAFSYIGYSTKEVEINGQKEIKVVLEEAVTQLESVVVIGYGVQKKKDLTTAVVVVDEKAIKDRPIVSAAEALQGKAAGVQVVQYSGKPGEDLSVRVRGATSVTAGNEPLYVVDGIQTTDIKGLNASDIATISVLKDASSTSIYGARAANGVVLITTKRGKANESTITFNTYYGISMLRKTIEVLTTKKYRDLMDEINPGSLDPTWTNYTNWSDEVFKTGVNQNYQLSYSGGTLKNRYLISGSYLVNKGIINPAEFNRFSVRMNSDNEIKNWLSVGTNINLIYGNTINSQDNASSGRGGIIMSALNTPPFLRIYKSDGSGQFEPNPFQPSWENPIAYMKGPDQLSKDIRILANFNINIRFTPQLVLKTNVGFDNKINNWDSYLDPFRTNFGRNQNGIGYSNKSNNQNFIIEPTLNYSTLIGGHNINVMVGTSTQTNNYNLSYLNGSDFPSNTDVRTLNAANIITGGTIRDQWRLVSGFTRFTYDYLSKYLFAASIRQDGSSKLANHWGVMPSASFAWRASAEPFLKNIKNLDDLKLRIGWGRNGNQEGISSYARYGLLGYSRRTPTSPLSGPATYQISYGNPDLKWETTTQTNIGIDLLMYNGRLSVTADAYIKKTNDLILDVQLPASSAISTIQTNAGSMENRGIELGVSTINLVKTWKWTTDFNISFNKNQITETKYTDVYYFGRIYSNNQDVAIVKKGLALGSFFGYVADGVNPETGNMKYKDLNNNGIFDPGDRTVIGTGQPDFVFGLTNTFTYKNFELNIFFNGSYGNEIYNATRIDLEGMFDSKNQSTAVLRRWTPTNTNTDIPRIAKNGSIYNVLNSTRFIEDGSFIRLKSVTFGYNWKGGILQKAKINNIKFYVTGQNLLTLTKYSGFDPEVNAYGGQATVLGVDYGTYPNSMNVVFGINADF